MLLASVVPALGQDRGTWRAASSTTKTVTGDIAISDAKIMINFATFPTAQVRALSAGEISAAFDADSNAGGNGILYRVSVPAETKFLHHNTLCGTENTHWMVTYVLGRSLQVAFFSGQAPPVLTVEAVGSSTDLCGVYSYSR
jgi:hypothetical protein